MLLNLPYIREVAVAQKKVASLAKKNEKDALNAAKAGVVQIESPVLAALIQSGHAQASCKKLTVGSMKAFVKANNLVSALKQRQAAGTTR